MHVVCETAHTGTSGYLRFVRMPAQHNVLFPATISSMDYNFLLAQGEQECGMKRG